VTFRWRDAAHNNEQKLMTLALDEFLRRFLLHVLPKGLCASATSVAWPTGDAPLSCHFVFNGSAQYRKRRPIKTTTRTSGPRGLMPICPWQVTFPSFCDKWSPSPAFDCITMSARSTRVDFGCPTTKDIEGGVFVPAETLATLAGGPQLKRPFQILRVTLLPESCGPWRNPA
jgi:hypothetical protein